MCSFTIIIILQAVIKEETLDNKILPDGTEIELNTNVTSKPVDEALKMISDATIIVPGSEEAIEVETHNKDEEESVGSVVKDLGEVSANEMKEIIEGAEVIVEEVVSEVVKNSEEAKEKQEEVINEITTEKVDVIKEEHNDSPTREELIKGIELDDSVLEVQGEVPLTELTESVVESTLKDIEFAVSDGLENISSSDKDSESEQTDVTNKDEELLKESKHTTESNESEESKLRELSDKTVVR